MFDFIHLWPLWYAKIGAAILFLIVLVVTWLIPFEFIMKGAPDRSGWRDLRIWATLLIAVQGVIYIFF